MTLRARLLLSLGVLLTVAFVAAGALVVGLTRASLVEQLDNELRNGRSPLLQRRGGPADLETDPAGRRIAWVVIGPGGRVIGGFPSGPTDNPDPLPAISELSEAQLAAARSGRVVDGTSADGGTRYRLVIAFDQANITHVLAAPVSIVDGPIGTLVRNLALVGLAALAGVIAAGWIVLRRGLRPLEKIAATASTIAEGDLSPRADLPHDRTEVGRLGAAFDTMLDQIQGAFVQQQSALVAKERSEGRLRQFVADASHELRTPLAAVRGYADLYRAGGLEERERLEQAMSRIGTESRRMGRLVEDLLLLARLDQGRPLRRDLVDLSAIVVDAVADTRAVEPRRPIHAAVVEGIEVAGDDDRLRQVVGNLLANVRVHTPPEAPLEVTLGARDGVATLDCVDHGPGVEPAHAEAIFDRFFRADPARSRDRGGSGLGLSIAASVLHAHGGSVAYRPTLDGGATFTVRLPVHRVATRNGNGAADSNGNADSNGSAEGNGPADGGPG